LIVLSVRTSCPTAAHSTLFAPSSKPRGAFRFSQVDHHNKVVGAAGVRRLIERLDLHSVVLTAVDPVAVPWSGADWCYFPSSDELRLNPQPGRKAEVQLDYSTETDQTSHAGVHPPRPPLPVAPASAETFGAAVFGVGGSSVLTSSVKKDFATEAAACATP